MKIKGICWLLIVVGVLAVIGLMFFLERTGGAAAALNSPIDKPIHSGATQQGGGPAAQRTADNVLGSKHGTAKPTPDVANSGGVTEGEADRLSVAERREREEARLVNAFDSLTDKWMEPAKEGVTMRDVDEFVAQFRKVPKARKDECLHRALNLVPDENVMLLAGILMDKSQDKELIETVYNDVLNRDESVKKPILQQIFKDREHPCWADTAWILDVTGELPGKK